LNVQPHRLVSMNKVNTHKACAIDKPDFRLGIAGQHKIGGEDIGYNGMTLVLSLVGHQCKFHPAAGRQLTTEVVALGRAHSWRDGQALQATAGYNPGSIPDLALVTVKIVLISNLNFLSREKAAHEMR